MYYSKKISSPIGTLYLISNEKALISLDTKTSERFKLASKNDEHKVLKLVARQLEEYFNGKRSQFDLPIEPEGTAFQQKAWKALTEIPFGSVWSYGEQARFLKSPTACRAVGGANGANPIPIIIPCHRVIGATGKLTGYSGGMKMKIDLLKFEGHQIDGLQLIKS